MFSRFQLAGIAVSAVLSVAGIANAVVIYVDADATGANDGSSWTDAYLEVAQATAAAVPGDDIWVASAGEHPYLPDVFAPGDPSASFGLTSGVGLFGGFLGNAHPTGGETMRDERDFRNNPTVLSGDIGVLGDNSDNTHHVVNGSGADATAILSGFQITAGNANGAPGSNAAHGGGLFVDGGGPTIENCVFLANTALGAGGGARLQGSSTTTFTHCAFLGNTAGSAGAIFVTVASVRATNCVFSGNSAVDGGAVLCYFGSETIFTNCTFSRNSATVAGSVGAILFFLSAGTVSNSVFFDNTPDHLWTTKAASNSPLRPTISHSNIQGLFPANFSDGGGNIATLSEFPNADGDDNIIGTTDDDLRLAPGSPCIDAANTNAPGLIDIATDLDGQGRFADDPDTTDCQQSPGTCGTAPIVDMGAYEFTPAPAVPTASQWGALVFSLLVVIAGTILFRLRASRPAQPRNASCRLH
jgi:parallel beta helix pectate lyase-like protein